MNATFTKKLTFLTPIQYIKGVGPKLAEIFKKKEIKSVEDLLGYFPRIYEDQKNSLTIDQIKPNELVSIRASVVKVQVIPLGRSGKKLYQVLVKDPKGSINCKFFKLPYKGYLDAFKPYTLVRVIGKPIMYKGQVEFHHPQIRLLQEDELIQVPAQAKAQAQEQEQGQELVQENLGRAYDGDATIGASARASASASASASAGSSDLVIPIYPEIDNLSSAKIHKLILTALEDLDTSEWHEYFSDDFLEKNQLPTLKEAYEQIHKPQKQWAPFYLQRQVPGQKRFIFEDFFWFELGILIKKNNQKSQAGLVIKSDIDLVEKVQAHLPFVLTSAQVRVFHEISNDLKSGYVMSRLVQGDVGSGKTILAFLSAFLVIQNGYQVALMAPTEILAQQHLKNALKLLPRMALDQSEIEILTSKATQKQKTEIIQRLSQGEIKLLIGTHALIEDDVVFKNLGLIIIDEQHRFGVHQRAKLKLKSIVEPHFLVMTATPIPRTLALTLYGDLDVSVVNELPKGRLPIQTHSVGYPKREKVFNFMQEEVKRGRQAYVVYPLIEESEKLDLKNALQEFENLKSQYLDVRFGLLHGKMKSIEKEQIMNQFQNHEFDVLVSTTVIEVGVDVPNATLMIIEHAERFGLSQLHQLRGRVGRGDQKSYCVLMAGYALSEEGKYRLSVMESTQDGFKISEADLELRGPGEFLGTRQAGAFGFRYADLVKDAIYLEKARAAALELLKQDPKLESPKNQSIKNFWNKKNQGLNYLDIG